VPTGAFRSLIDGASRRRTARPAPSPKKGAGPAPKKSRSPTLFAILAVALCVLNVPLFLVAANHFEGMFGSGDGPLSIAEIVELEQRIATSPSDGEALLAAEGLDRESWVELLAALAADPEFAAELRELRANVSN
jgi:hypothetical protein